MTRIMLALGLFLFCAACSHPVGHDFPMAEQANLVLGVTTKSDVQARFGEPSTVNTETKSNDGPQPATEFDTFRPAGTYSTLDYRYAVVGGRLATGLGAKLVRLVFLDNRLVSYYYIDNFVVGSTNFDESRVGQIVKGVSRKEDIIALLGQPAGKWGPPLLAVPGGEAYAYAFTANTLAGEAKSTKSLTIIFDRQGRVKDLRFHTQAG